MNGQELKDLDIKMKVEVDKMEKKRHELVELECNLKKTMRDLQDKKEIELIASDELKKTETILFSRENKEYESETKHREEK